MALVARFPDEEAAIRKYVETCLAANKAADIWFFSKIFSVAVQRLVLSALAYWSPICGELEYLPSTVFPFVLVFEVSTTS